MTLLILKSSTRIHFLIMDTEHFGQSYCRQRQATASTTALISVRCTETRFGVLYE